MILTIGIPTYNRVDCLDDCFNSILISHKNCDDFDYEICISDNHSKRRRKQVIEKYQNKLPLKFNKNNSNLGFALNALKVVSMSSGKFVWMIGNDDLLLPNSLSEIKKLFKKSRGRIFFY